MADELLDALARTVYEVLRDAMGHEALKEATGWSSPSKLQSALSRNVEEDLETAMGEAIREIVREELDKRA